MEVRELQDGARTPRGTARLHNEVRRGQESVEKLAKYARTSPPLHKTSGQSAGTGRASPQLADSEREDSDGVCSSLAVTQADKLIARRELQSEENLQNEHTEPTLSDVLRAVNKCNNALSSLTIQLKDLKGDITHIRHDVQEGR